MKSTCFVIVSRAEFFPVSKVQFYSDECGSGFLEAKRLAYACSVAKKTEEHSANYFFF
jgi:hypothetical protein